jgi:signal transduction histidine kinase/HPt (histidine-containing phosphotransfer) domain-containing protein
MNESQKILIFDDMNVNGEISVREWLRTLTADTTLGGIPSFEVTVSPEMLTSVVDRELGSAPDVPGVVIASGTELLGMISRPMLFAQLSRPFGQDLYLKRPIRLLLEAERNEPLVLPSDMLVSEAAHTALHRPADRVYEPVVVRDSNEFRLLDVHTLLIAQSQLLLLANETIRSQADVAEAANRAKSLFLANMSHEIRTPLTAILGFAENLLDPTCATDERTAATETILRNGHHLLQLINDILDLSKIEAERLEIEQLKFSPGELAADVISALRVRADAKQIGLSLTYEGPIPDMIESDPTRVRQILMNLISNGIKFTERGHVNLRMSMRDENGDLCRSSNPGHPLWLQCDVVDTGIGMSEEQLARLFTPFMQADESMARRFGGTGLGLSISRRLARMLGGDVVAASQKGVGSTFRVHIDAGAIVDTKWHDRPSSIGKLASPVVRSADLRLSGRFLLAEDGPDNQLLIGSFLRKQGADLTIVDNGRKAVDTALASMTDGNPFRIILMDMQMPILDGYSATSELRARGWTRPILALTANVMQGDRQKCTDAGCNDFATKPINRSELIEQILALISEPAESSTSPETNAGIVETPVISGDAFDRAAALERVGGDEDLLRQIAEMFVQICPEWLDSLQRHLNERDQTAARRMAHSLKSSADNVGGHLACASMSRLENAAAEGCLDEAISMWPECRGQYVRLLDAVSLFTGKNN